MVELLRIKKYLNYFHAFSIMLYLILLIFDNIILKVILVVGLFILNRVTYLMIKHLLIHLENKG